jgi:hypothetical protein
MSKKKNQPVNEGDDFRGFKEFIESETDKSFLYKKTHISDKKNDKGFEHLTFLTNDSIRIQKLKKLLTEKIPFSIKYNQSQTLTSLTEEQIKQMKSELFTLCEQEESHYRASLRKLFNNLYGS